MTLATVFFFGPQKPLGFTGQSPGPFYPGGAGSAREMAKSKPELLNEWLGGGWGLGGGLALRPGVGSRLGHCLQHW